MALGSLIAGIAAMLLMIAGMFLTIVPFAGTILSFAAPLVAIAGIVMGGLAMSRAKREGGPTGLATGGLVVNIVMLIPALLVAVTCGLCNACFTAGSMAPRRDGGALDYDYDFHAGFVDAGVVPGDPSGPAAAAGAVPTGPPTPEELAEEVASLNELCGDTFCEGEYDYRFETLSCRPGACRLTFRARSHDAGRDAPYEEHSVDIPVSGDVLECDSWEYQGGVDRCTGRGMTEGFAEALYEAIAKWEADPGSAP